MKLIRVIAHIPPETDAEINRKVSASKPMSKSAVIAMALVDKFPAKEGKSK